MVHETIKIATEGSLEYARLVTYIWDESPEIPVKKRPIVLICPGGGYCMTSDREAESVALRLMCAGVHAAVLRYSVRPAEYPTALLEVAQAVALLRSRAEEWGIMEDKIVVMGFSAGGHLAASYAENWNRSEVAEKTGVSGEMLRPNGLLLCYPVITSDKRYWHQGSFENLLGSQWSEERLEAFSLEKHVGEQIPKTFLWHTYEDTSVPVENSLLFVMALRRQGIPTEFHMYEKGVHGLSLAKPHTNNMEGTCVQTECQSWIDLAEIWLGNL